MTQAHDAMHGVTVGSAPLKSEETATMKFAAFNGTSADYYADSYAHFGTRFALHGWTAD